jgi:O-antigen/teichoic acid export membrane protein
MVERRLDGLIYRNKMSSNPSLTASNPALVRAKTFAGALWLVSWRMLTRVIGLGSTLVLARVLVPADFGLLGMATAFSASVDAISLLGLQEALVRRRSDDKEIYNTAFTLQLGRSVITGAILLLFSPLAAAWFKEPRLIAVLGILAAASLISGFENIGMVEYRRELRFDVQFKLLLWPRLIQVAVTIGFAILLKSYWALLWGIIATKVAKTVLTYTFHPHRPKFQISGWRELAGFSFWTWATGLASLLWDRSDPFVLGPRFGAAGLGLYLMASDIALLPMSEIIAPASDALSTGFAVAQKDGESSMHLGPKVAATMMLMLLPIIITISGASGDIVEVLLGPKWKAAQPLVAVLAWMCVMSPFSYCSSTVMVANGFVRHNFIANLAVSIIKIVVLVTVVTLLPNLFAVSTSGAACVAMESLIFIALLKHASGISLRNIRPGVGRIFVAGSLSLAVLWLTKLGWHPGRTGAVFALLHGALIALVATASYGVSLFLLWKIARAPDGPERWAAELIVPKLRKILKFGRE